MNCRAAFLVVVLALGSSTGAWAADAFASLPSYRATFKMSLVGESSDPTVSSADGQMFFEWKRVCGGYSYLQQSYTDYVSPHGRTQRQELSSQSFESTDGTHYRFHFIDRMDGMTSEEYQGRGRLSLNGKGGVIDYTKPTPGTVDIPAGSVFPTIYTMDILDAAKAGKRVVSRNIFDGMGSESRYDAIAFISDEKKAETQHGFDAMVDPKGILAGHRYWNISIAFYTKTTPGGMPDYQMSARFYDNGVTTHLVFNYGDIIMKGDLERIEPVVDESCTPPRKP